jgi:hypothetical protein
MIRQKRSQEVRECDRDGLNHFDGNVCDGPLGSLGFSERKMSRPRGASLSHLMRRAEVAKTGMFYGSVIAANETCSAEEMAI